MRCRRAHVGAAGRALSPLQWDAVENKTTVVVYGAGGVVVLWLAATIVGALNSIPLVGAGTWVVCRPPCWAVHGRHSAQVRGGVAQAVLPRSHPSTAAQYV